MATGLNQRFPKEKREAFEQFFRRLDPLREIRNHIAHGVLRIGLSPDQKTYVQTLSLPRDLDGSNSAGARHLSFAELQAALSTLNSLIEEFQHLAEFKNAGCATIGVDLKR